MRLIDADALVKDGYVLHRTYRQDEKTMVYETKRIEDIPTAQIELNWIPCSERLPEDGKWCIFTDGDNISVERYKFDALDHFFPPGRWFDLDDAVAWMPLPEPYGGEQDD